MIDLGHYSQVDTYYSALWWLTVNNNRIPRWSHDFNYVKVRDRFWLIPWRQMKLSIRTYETLFGFGSLLVCYLGCYKKLTKKLFVCLVRRLLLVFFSERQQAYDCICWTFKFRPIIKFCPIKINHEHCNYLGRKLRISTSQFTLLLVEDLSPQGIDIKTYLPYSVLIKRSKVGAVIKYWFN